MSESKVVLCPQCKQEAAFVRTGRLYTCSSCGFQYESGGSSKPVQPAEGWGFLRVLGKLILIMVGVIVVGYAILYAGCGIIFSGW